MLRQYKHLGVEIKTRGINLTDFQIYSDNLSIHTFNHITRKQLGENKNLNHNCLTPCARLAVRKYRQQTHTRVGTAVPTIE